MTADPKPPLPDDILHAYVDDVLPDAERQRVDAHLAEHADDRQRVAAYRAQNLALHVAFDPVLEEPHGMTVTARAPVGSHRVPWAMAASLLAAVAVGGAMGYGLRGWQAPGAAPGALARQAVMAHQVYLPEVRHPVEVGAAEEAHLVAWLSKRLNAPLRTPELASAGYRLLGGRLLPAESAAMPAEGSAVPVALLMYENAQGQRLSLLVRNAGTGAATAFRFSEQGGTRVFYWIDGPFGYALAGTLARDELAELAQLVYRQLNP
jgi:anti-sigma factor RsiW